MERRAKVLVIDDEPDMVEMLKMALERRFEVMVAYDGEEGLAAARTGSPDAIVLDVRMPGKDGFAVCRELKGKGRTLSIPVLILTSAGSHFGRSGDSKPGGLEGEAEDYLAKPVDPNELVARVAALLKKG